MTHAPSLTPEDEQLLHELRQQRRHHRAKHHGDLSFGQRLADGVAATVGSWRFIIVQSGLLALWIVLNVVGWIQAWDPYPFILLNLALSFQAAYTAPILMMSQNRQAEIDRHNADSDYKINIKAELEIEQLHQKIDLLREQEVVRLTRAVELLLQRLDAAEGKGAT
ncbi:DUF1003 domain-containing protein [Mycobacterium sp. KBS0706]|uniref:DUF1003 domain-containing protein n=1 Tax=Mycobacterium sp. KBS0706 TaxID=2578109 RepID=UPI00110F6BB2|nr:DUF1003 domain-containing protein [Mycobacterium sp. KBS0706]TSD87047.1 DUF1003 domain-containing protein [Mycobacterium sp. KBS0706]